MTEGRAGPGETPPRTLARPPGDRYRRTVGMADGHVPTGDGGAVRGPDLLHASWFAALAALGTALVLGFLIGVLDLGPGLIAAAAVGGWAIGVATRTGAWRGVIGRPADRVRALAIVMALAAWVGGHFSAYLLSLLLRPGSSLSLGERIAREPFVDWLTPQFGLLQVVEIVLLGGVAWYTSRSR